MARKLLIKTVSLSLMIFWGSLITVYAQGPAVGQEEEPMVVAPTGRLNLTLKQLGYESRTLTREQNSRVFDVNLPGNFQFVPTGNYLELITSHLPEIPEKPSILTTEVNKRLVSTFTLTRTNAISNATRIALPEGLLQPGRNSISINLDTGGTCEDAGAFLNLIVDENSLLSFEYQQKPFPTDLALYPWPFAERSLLNIPVTIVLPNQPSSVDLSTAATIAAGLGQASGGNIVLNTVSFGDLTPDIQNNNHLIVVGRPEANGLLGELAWSLPIDETTLKPAQGILQEIVSPWNEFRLALAVSGADDEGLLKAGNALNRQAHFLGMRGPVAIVIELGSLSKADNRRASSITLASLNYEDEVIYGTLPQDHRFEFDLPRAWQLETPPYFALKFAHADIISGESVLDVKLNGVPVGSTLLDDSNAVDGELTVSLPERLLRAGTNRLDVSVEMRLPDIDINNRCASLGDERAWTVLSNESEIFLDYNALDLNPDLSLFPYPFSQYAGFDQTALLLPDQPSAQVINQMMQLAVRLGSASQSGYISPQVRYASEVDQEIRQNRHLILFGRPTENALLAEINASLPQPFLAESDALQPLAVDSVAFLPDPERDAGLIEIIPSPWNEKYSLLAITGTTSEGVGLAVQALLEQLQRLKGNLAVVEPALDPLSNELSQISTYSVDTRQSRVSQASSETTNSPSQADLPGLANRWWK